EPAVNPAKTTIAEENTTIVNIDKTLPGREPINEPQTEPSTEPVSEPQSEPSTEPVSEPQSEPSTEPVSEPQSEPSTEPVSEPQSEPSTEPVSEPQTEPLTEPQTEPVSEPVPETTVPAEEPLIPVPADEMTYIFVADSFVGAYGCGEWLSVSDVKVNYPQCDHTFYLQDILLPAEYSIYDYKGILQSDDEIILHISDGLGGFTDVEMAIMAPYGIDTGFDMDGSTRIFALPMQLDELAAKVSIPDYNFSAYALTASEYAPVMTNASHNILPWVISNDSPSQEDIAFMSSYLDQLGLKDAEVCIDNIYSGDFDNDGFVERLLIANSNDEYTVWQEFEAAGGEAQTGAYAFALLLHENGFVEEIFSEYHKFDLEAGFDWTLYYFQIYGDGIYDFNGDGIGELALEYAGWEWGNARIYTRNIEGYYEMVLKGDWGM
ncbi:MAG: procyclic acidic repetitive family protein, partial [Firmicutes bacterium]|nr:procyclic acidic repetitive family protein [Bacillota bacterium]